MSILVDTDVLIAHLRGIEEAHRWLADARATHGPLRVSVVTGTEIRGGMRSAERSAVARLLDSVEWLPVTRAIAARAGNLMRQYRRSHSGIGLGDYLIAGTVEQHGLELATLNVKHFPMWPELTAPFALN